MRQLQWLAPAAMLALLTLLAALPWGLSAEHRFFLPLLPFIAVFRGSLAMRGAMPVGLAFASGLCIDILTFGPLGFWALVHVAGWLAAAAVPHDFAGGALARWLTFAALAALLVALVWALASLLGAALTDWRPFARAAVAICAVYPFVAPIWSIMVLRPGSPAPASLERGR